MNTQPNILVIMPDQMRGDCFGLAGHPSLITPNIDALGAMGCRFSRAYSTCPSCIPARRAFLTGLHPSSSGSVGFATPAYDTPTLPGLLGQAGYHSVLVGRHMHQDAATDQNPGYETCILGSTYEEGDCYAEMLDREVPLLGGIRGLGVDFNGWQAKSWPLAEHLHPTNWVVRQAREVIADHDDDRALFLTASFYAPHPPLIPPDFYYQRYLNMALPDKAVGEWAGHPPERGAADSAHVNLKGETLRMAQAAYYGLINHLDDQLTWLILDFVSTSQSQKRPWVIAFTSDHGEMLGDHYTFRKCEPLEGSSRIPFLIRSEGLGQKPSQDVREVVCLEDLLPTLLELSGTGIPDAVDGKSLVPLLRGEGTPVRQWLHCEHSPCYSREQAFQMVTDGRWKYIWRPMTGEELLFDLEQDPTELTNLASDPSVSSIRAEVRSELTTCLCARPEGFVREGQLRVVDEWYPPVMQPIFPPVIQQS